MINLNTLAASLLAASALVSSANATDFSVHPDTCNNGEKGCTVVMMKGKIIANDGGKFLELMFKERPTKLVLFLDSEGGDVTSALQIGRHLKANNYSTYVGRNSACASACAMIWLAGHNKNIHATAQIAFHAAYLVSTDGKRYKESGEGNAVVGAYYSELGYSEEAIRFFTKSAPDSASYLTDTVAKKLSIKYKLIEDKN
jgi:hypothetical protein